MHFCKKTLGDKLLSALLASISRKGNCLSASVSSLNFMVGCLDLKYQKMDTGSHCILKDAKVSST